MTTCIVCQSDQVEQFLDLGRMALANNFLTHQEILHPVATFPLRVGFCRNCCHVQLMEHVSPEEMFTNYLYISSMSDTLKEHLFDLARAVCERCHLNGEHLVYDIGSNDGTLLSGFRSRGVRTLGIDPAKNLADRARNVGVETYSAFFSPESAPTIRQRYGPANVVTSTNSFPHIPDLVGFVRALDCVLAPDGTLVIEMHYLVDLLEQAAFDTIYHEHVSYWALGPMTRLFRHHGFEVVEAERLGLHHGQLRVFVQRRGSGVVHQSVAEILELERALGLTRFETYSNLANNAYRIKRELGQTLRALVRDGKRVAGYGAPAKANTLLGFLELGPDVFSYVVDRSPLKQGLHTPDTHIPILPPERLLEDQPDYVVLLAWNFVDEILSQQAEYRQRGGKFVIPLPEVRII